MSKNIKYRLIGKLYMYLKENKIYSSEKDFVEDFFLTSDPNPNTINWIISGDFYGKTILDSVRDKFNNIEEYLTIIEKNLSSFPISQYSAFNDKLIEIIDSTDTYISRRPPKNQDAEYHNYDQDCKDKILAFYEIQQNYFDLKYNIFILIYFSIYKTITKELCYGLENANHLDIFNKEVSCQYGIHSIAGIRKIIHLATCETPNIYALFEYADMFYYGCKYGPQKNLHQAFIYYKKAAGINFTNNNIEGPFHPLALWSLAYIYINYQKKGTPLEKSNDLPEIEYWSLLDRYSIAIRYCKYVMKVMDNGPATNTLGNIALLSDDDIPGINALKLKENLNTAEYYYSKAINANYVYAYINMAKLKIDESFKFTDFKKSEECVEKAIEYLDKAAKQYEPYAANLLGRLYIEGILPSIEGTQPIIMDKEQFKNPQKALGYFHLAIDHFCNTYHSAYAYANIIKFFPEQFDNNHELLHQYIHSIESLKNTDALKIAMDALDKINKTNDILRNNVNKKI